MNTKIFISKAKKKTPYSVERGLRTLKQDRSLRPCRGGLFSLAQEIHAKADKAGLLADGADSSRRKRLLKLALNGPCPRLTPITVMAVAPDSHRLPFSPGQRAPPGT